jgi:hypothetical protein
LKKALIFKSNNVALFPIRNLKRKIFVAAHRNQ